MILLTQGAGPAAAPPAGIGGAHRPGHQRRHRALPARPPTQARSRRRPVASGWSPDARAALSPVDPVSGAVRRPGGPGSPRDLAALDDTIYVISAGSDFALGALTLYDVFTGQRRQGIPALDCSIAAGPDFGIATSACPSVQRIDHRAGRLTAAWETLIPYPEPHTAEHARACQCDMSVAGRDLWLAGDPDDPRVCASTARPHRRRRRDPLRRSQPRGRPRRRLGHRPARLSPREDRPETNRVTDTLPTGRGARGWPSAPAGSGWRTRSTGPSPASTPARGGWWPRFARAAGPPVTVGDGAVWVTVDDGRLAALLAGALCDAAVAAGCGGSDAATPIRIGVLVHCTPRSTADRAAHRRRRGAAHPPGRRAGGSAADGRPARRRDRRAPGRDREGCTELNAYSLLIEEARRLVETEASTSSSAGSASRKGWCSGAWRSGIPTDLRRGVVRGLGRDLRRSAAQPLPVRAGRPQTVAGLARTPTGSSAGAPPRSSPTTTWAAGTKPPGSPPSSARSVAGREPRPRVALQPAPAPADIRRAQAADGVAVLSVVGTTASSTSTAT